MIPFFATALFVSAMLLFWVQPMVAKMLLPLLGGTPTVWNTCMVFFQAVLLAGYAYAHFLTTRFSIRIQTTLHLVLMLITLVALPIGIRSDAAHSDPWNSDPLVWLARALLLVVALPFFTVSASGPLLQSWFSRTGHKSAKDPYFLYAASNLGSLIGLLGYPILLEPRLHLGNQTWLWEGIYCFLVVLFAFCGLLVWRTRNNTGGQTDPPTQVSALAENLNPVTTGRRLRWVLWALIPSSLMLGVTTYLTTDIAPAPLLWVVPLAIYLFTFILVFGRHQVIPLGSLVRGLPIAAVALVFLMLTGITNPAWLLIVLHLVFFFLATMLSHTRLANDRPSSRHLTEFYFCLSIGGVLGGIFNALIAPAVFKSIAEYPLMIVVACTVWPGSLKEGFAWPRFWRAAALPLGVGLLTMVLAILVPKLGMEQRLRVTVVFGLPVVLCYFLSKQPWRFGLGLASVLLASHFYTAVHGETLRSERNFFGALRITIDPETRFHRLYHGTTVHGIQSVDPKLQGEPLAYFHRLGPCGDALAAWNSRSNGIYTAVIGLGADTMASYAVPGQHWTFYEIDPAVIEFAQDTNYFTYLQRCTNATVDFKVGDARLRLREAPPQHFDLLVCDAFGSDVPPLHLLNREAMELYLSKLGPNGMLLFHISSRYLDFRPVIAGLAEHFQLIALSRNDTSVTEAQMQEGRFASLWVALARKPEDLGPLLKNPDWSALQTKPNMRLWTDDYSSIMAIFDWR
jgi:hypothetical protein